MENEQNTCAKVLSIAGVLIIIIGFIAGLVLGKSLGEYEQINWGVAFSVIVSSIISGILLISFAEVVNLLQRQTDTLVEIQDTLDQIKKNTKSESN